MLQKGLIFQRENTPGNQVYSSNDSTLLMQLEPPLTFGMPFNTLLSLLFILEDHPHTLLICLDGMLLEIRGVWNCKSAPQDTPGKKIIPEKTRRESAGVMLEEQEWRRHDAERHSSEG